MTAFNVVRFRLKPGREEQFIEAHRKAKLNASGFRRAHLVKTGDDTYCFVGEWDAMSAISAARPDMIAILDSFRDCLHDLGDGKGLTDPVSGEAVLELR